jgi:hypothetical protein
MSVDSPVLAFFSMMSVVSFSKYPVTTTPPMYSTRELLRRIAVCVPCSLFYLAPGVSAHGAARVCTPNALLRA